MKTISNYDLKVILSETREVLGFHTESGIEIRYDIVSKKFGEDYIGEFYVSIWPIDKLQPNKIKHYIKDLQSSEEIVEELNEKYAGAKIEY